MRRLANLKFVVLCAAIFFVAHACDLSEYKSADDCIPCPVNSIQSSDETLCTCVDGAYRDVNGLCVSCPMGAICDGGESTPRAEAGYWQEPGTANFLRCQPDSCLGNGTCADGHTGVLCGSCLEGYHQLTYSCYKCQKEGVWYTAAISVFLLLFVIVGLKTYLGSLAILIDVMQVLSSYNIFAVGWPNYLVIIFNGFSIGTRANIDLAGPECVMGASYYQRWLLDLLIPVVLLVLYVIVFVIHVSIYISPCMRRRRAPSADELRMARRKGPSRFDHMPDEDDPEREREREREGPTPPSSQRELLGFGEGLDVTQSSMAETETSNPRLQAFGNTLHPLSTTPTRGSPINEERTPLAGGDVSVPMVRTISGDIAHVIDPYINYSLETFNTLYLNMLLVAFQHFQCIKISDSVSALSANPNVVCYDSQWWTLMWVALVAILLYGIGVPVVYAVILRRYAHDRDSEAFRRRFGTLTHKYERPYFWWDLIVFARRLCFAACTLFPTDHVVRQVVAVLAAMVLFNMFQMHAHPYVRDAMDVLEGLGLVLSLCVMLVGLLFAVGIMPSDGKIIAYIIIGFFALSAALFFLDIVIDAIRKIRKLRIKRKQHSDSLPERALELIDEMLNEEMVEFVIELDLGLRTKFLTVCDSLQLLKIAAHRQHMEGDSARDNRDSPAQEWDSDMTPMGGGVDFPDGGYMPGQGYDDRMQQKRVTVMRPVANLYHSPLKMSSPPPVPLSVFTVDPHLHGRKAAPAPLNLTYASLPRVATHVASASTPQGEAAATLQSFPSFGASNDDGGPGSPGVSRSNSVVIPRGGSRIPAPHNRRAVDAEVVAPPDRVAGRLAMGSGVTQVTSMARARVRPRAANQVAPAPLPPKMGGTAWGVNDSL